MTDAPRVLRPLSVADIVDEIFRLYRRNFALFFGTAALVWIPASVFFTAGLALLGNVGSQRLPSASDLEAAAPLLLVGAVVLLVGFPVLLGALTAAVSDRYLGRPATVASSLARGVRAFWRIVGAYLLVFVALLGVSALATGSFVLAAVSGGGVGVLVTIVSLIVLVVAFVWITVTWSLLTQAIVIEDAGPREALSRSAGLVAGSRWRVLGINALLAILQAVLFGAPEGTIGAILISVAGDAGAALAQLVSVLAQVLYFPIQLGTTTLLYYDLRVRKEALDLTLAAEELRRS